MSKDDIHIVPLDDLLPHNTDSSECRCDPKIEVDGGHLLIIHNSYDGREDDEAANDFVGAVGGT